MVIASLLAVGASAVLAGAQEPTPGKSTVLTPTPPVPECNDDRLKNDSLLRFTGKQRLCVFYHDATSPSSIFGAIGATGFAAITSTEDPRFGTGAAALAPGFSTRYAQSATKSAGEYLVDWAVGQDPRASRHHGSVAHRIKASAASLFVTSNDSMTHFKPGPLAGAAAGGFIALAWETRDKQSVEGAFQHMGMSLAGSLVSAEFHEFSPEIMRWVSNRFEPKLK